MIEAAARHKGTAFIEILQNCVVFNDNVLASFTDRSLREENWVYLEHGKPIRFGKDLSKGIVCAGRRRPWAWSAKTACAKEDLMVHDAHASSSAMAFFLAGLGPPVAPTALGIFRQVEKPTYDQLLMGQIQDAVAANGRGELSQLLNAGTTWLVEPPPAHAAAPVNVEH